jgi:integrase/recombinase XerD
MKLSTTLIHLKNVSNPVNAALINDFHQYLIEIGTSINYQNQNLKQIINFARHLGKEKTFYAIRSRDEIISFLNTKIKDSNDDPDKKWITTWNDYLWRIKYFFRWLQNYKLVKENGQEPHDLSDWITPTFVSIKKKKTKRISPYLETELWEKEELVCIIKYEPSKRNKAILALLWDLNARPHEICLIKNKHIRLREKYGEGEIPHDAKTGTGPVLLTTSFIFVRDWINEHPFKNEPNSRLICNLNNGSPITSDTIDKVMKQLRKRIIRLLESDQIKENDEKAKLRSILETKKWNPYCIRHSAITADSDYLPDFALKKKVRWSMNSKQGNRYIKRRMGNDLKQKILVYNGIISPDESHTKPAIISCPRCELISSAQTRYCPKCSYPLVPSAYDEIKESEENRLRRMEEQITILMESRKELLECMRYPKRLTQITHDE